MNKEFVPYELAVKLSEHGFNEPCIRWFDDKGNFYMHFQPGYINGNNENYIAVIKEYNTGTIPSPLWQQVTTWLRHTWKINVFVGYRPNVKKWDAHWYDMTMNGKEYVKQYSLRKQIDCKVFDTYEEALESAIIDYLNNN
jgi:uncharacterized protein YpmS